MEDAPNLTLAVKDTATPSEYIVMPQDESNVELCAMQYHLFAVIP
jgi:hypothetical protein